jgi:branched-chain amino acid transport system substrate-binding protein
MCTTCLILSLIGFAAHHAAIMDLSIDAFFGLSDTDPAQAAGHAACAAGKVFITSGASSPRLPSEACPRVFLACFDDSGHDTWKDREGKS